MKNIVFCTSPYKENHSHKIHIQQQHEETQTQEHGRFYSLRLRLFQVWTTREVNGVSRPENIWHVLRKASQPV
jgi:hypothetical protein